MEACYLSAPLIHDAATEVEEEDDDDNNILEPTFGEDNFFEEIKEAE